MGREATSAMSDFDRVAWFPLCAGLTGLGLVGSWVALRRRGVGAGLRGAAWSLLPLAAYLTGVVALLWRVGTALVDWVGGFVLSPTVWAGVAVTAFAALLFAVSGMLRRRAPRRRAQAQGERRPAALEGAEKAPAGQGRVAPGKQVAVPGKQVAPRTKGDLDDDFAEVEEILRRRGIG